MFTGPMAAVAVCLKVEMYDVSNVFMCFEMYGVLIRGCYLEAPQVTISTVSGEADTSGLGRRSSVTSRVSWEANG